MLQRLSISNYVIIDQLELSFCKGLNVITGETGAGKSILLEALMLVLGERGDSSVLRLPDKKCIIEAEFVNFGEDVSELLLTTDTDAGPSLLLRRELMPNGKSRFFVNDTPVQASLMRQLAGLLVDMHRQHDSQELADHTVQLSVLDSLAGQQQAVQRFRQQYRNYRRDLDRLHLLEQQQADQDLDYLSFQLHELQAAALREGEQEQLEQEHKQLMHAGQILETLHQASYALADADEPLLTRMHQVRQALRAVASALPALDELVHRLDQLHQELGDIAHELHRLRHFVQPDPQRLQEVTDRLDVLYRLQKKHRVATVTDLLERARQLEERMQQQQLQLQQREELSQSVARQHRALLEQAEALSYQRQLQLEAAVSRINDMLADVGMPQARIAAHHECLPEGQLNAWGKDRIRFLFAPNRGGTFQDLARIASGGELSRLMLCFQSLIAAEAELPTLVFDEIDTGISGETAMKVARLMRRLAERHQVVCVTHLPQLAAKGERHFLVTKGIKNGRTQAHISALSEEEKIHAIARMISGQRITEAALASARELLEKN
ncbi:MAG: DNA repair protein RecN [Chitinophagales bacterium]|nr:DNA repair protein RecN [Chitinophagales bacterium]MDW8392922.1 DNA repair protein RecN [Chitinophagales bacterium]